MGWIAAAMLIAGFLLQMFAPSGDGQLKQMQAAAVRVGLVLACIWLAFPNFDRLTPRWIAVVGCIALAVVFRRAIPLAALLLVASLLAPRSFWEALRPAANDQSGPHNQSGGGAS